MKRSTQLKRTGFKPGKGRPVHVRTPLGLVIVGQQRGVYARSSPQIQLLKREYVRSESLLAEVRACKWCAGCYGPGPVQPAHSNWAVHGKAGAKKADDNRIAALCPKCHRELDQGSKWTEQERQDFWWRAHRVTVIWLLEEGRWPKWAPIPDIGYNPFEVLGEPAASAGALTEV